MNPDLAPPPDASELMPRPRGEGRETARLEASSDGVFAIAITLLILSIPVPTGLTTGDQLLAALRANGSAFAAYAISFATILVMWVNHHSVFKQVARVDRPFLMLNGLLYGRDLPQLPDRADRALPDGRGEGRTERDSYTRPAEPWR
jgi:hypothetical protein